MKKGKVFYRSFRTHVFQKLILKTYLKVLVFYSFLYSEENDLKYELKKYLR